MFSAGRDPLRVLVIEDSTSLRRTMVDYLRANGFAPLEAWSVEGALAVIGRHPPDVALLDLMLEDGEGHDLVQAFALKGIPVMVVSAKAAPDDRILCLELGAEDYMVKPFELREMLLRLRRIERILGSRPHSRGSPVAMIGTARVDMVERSIQRPDGSTEHLTDAEFRLLRLLIDHAGTVVPRERIAADVFRRDAAGDSRRVDVLVSKLRRKIDDPPGPTLVANVRNMGYVLQVAPGPAA